MKNALVTGGSRGIGLGIARELGVSGYRVAIVATRPEEACPETTRTLNEAGVDYAWITADVSRQGDRQRIVDEVYSLFGELHVLVNNAGVMAKERCDILDMTEDSYDYVMSINTKAPMFLTQLVARRMMEQPLQGAKRGTIVNIASLNSAVSSIRRGEYCVSKAGVSMITQLYADRLAPERIYVYEIRPGIIKTDMNLKVRALYTEQIENGLLPIGRWGMPEDIGKAVRALCSDDFCYSTGTVIDVDGGFHIRRL